MSHPNEKLVHTFFKAFAAGDMELLASITTDDLVMHEPGTTALAGDYHGRDKVIAFFGELGRVTGGTIKIDAVHQILANDAVGVALFDCSAVRNGETIRSQVAEIYTITEGRISDIRAHVYDMPEWDRAYRENA